MGNGSFRFEVDLGAAQKQVAFIKSWRERLKKVEPMIGYLGAAFVLDHVKKKLQGSQNKTYRDALEIVRVKGLRPGEYAYAVQIDESNKDVRQVKTNKQLIYVQPAKRFRRPSPEVLVLQKYNPWTADTLPFKPNSQIATVTTKTVRVMDVVKTTQLKNRQRPLWSGELAKLGVRVPPRSKAINFSKQTATLPNVALDAFKSEFGLGREKSNPAWRLAFSHLAKSGFRSFLKDRKNFIFPLIKPSFSVWKKWPPRTKHAISTPEAKKFQGFQKKIAPKSGG